VDYLSESESHHGGRKISQTFTQYRYTVKISKKIVCDVVAHVFRIWGDLEIAHLEISQNPETAQPSGDGWAVSGFGEISRWAKGVFRILKRPSPFQDLQIARTFLRLPKGIFTMKPLLIIYAVVEAVQKTLLENILRLPRKFSRLPRGIFRIEALVNDCLQATTHSLTHCCD